MPAQVPGPRIAVVGGGIGGLAAAAFLRRAGLTATVYEQAPALGEVGAGLVVAPNAVRLLRRLGVMEQLLRRAVPLDWGWEFRRWADGSVLSVEKLSGVCERLYGERTYVVHRADLLETVKSAVPGDWVLLGARCTSIDENPHGVRLRFADGSRVEADVVIGADGVHSVVRGTIADPAPPAYSGICAFRTIVPADAAPDFALRSAQTLWLGPVGISCTTRSTADGPSMSSPSPPPGTTRTSRGARRPRARSSTPSSPAGTRGLRTSSPPVVSPAAGRCWTGRRCGTGAGAGPPCSGMPRIPCSPSSPRARPSPSRTPRCWRAAWPRRPTIPSRR